VIGKKIGWGKYFLLKCEMERGIHKSGEAE